MADGLSNWVFFAEYLLGKILFHQDGCRLVQCQFPLQKRVMEKLEESTVCNDGSRRKSMSVRYQEIFVLRCILGFDFNKAFIQFDRVELVV